MKITDLTGMRFGRLVVVSQNGYVKRGVNRREVLWACRCDCGAEKSFRASYLRSGDTKSCGCLRPEIITKHGRTHTREFRIYHGMKKRCLNQKHNSWEHYGGRGIKICERWLNGADGFNGFELFLADMGEAPSSTHSIDRIDVNGNYEPGNCRWATPVDQSNNRRDTIRDRGETLLEISNKTGINLEALRTRIKSGDTGDRLRRPLHTGRRPKGFLRKETA